MTTRKIGLSSHAGRKGKCPPSFRTIVWMVGRVLSFPGTRSTDRFTRKQCGITLILLKRGLSLSTHLNQSPCQECQKLTPPHYPEMRGKRYNSRPIVFYVWIQNTTLHTQSQTDRSDACKIDDQCRTLFYVNTTDYG